MGQLLETCDIQNAPNDMSNMYSILRNIQDKNLKENKLIVSIILEIKTSILFTIYKYIYMDMLHHV